MFSVARGLAVLAVLLAAAGGYAMSSTPPGCGPADASCGADEFCAFAAGCGEDGAQGECRPRPQVCTMEYAPVCGCDDHTHSNACAAHGAGTSIRHTGPCAPDRPVQ